MSARTGITHYSWPGGLAAVIETPVTGAGSAAVFGPSGWRVGPTDAVFAAGPPPHADTSHLALPEALADQFAALKLVGSGLHTDFVRLDRLVARLKAEGTDAMLFVLGRAPAALVVTNGAVVVVEPDPSLHEPVDEVLEGADGWIVVGLGKVFVSAPAPVEAAPPSVATESDPAHPQTAPAAREPAVASGSPDAFGRFKGDARFVLAPSANPLPDGVAGEIAVAFGNAGTVLVGLLDGAHTLAQIAAATGLDPQSVVAVIETLVARKLVFKYVSRVRPPTGASTPG